MQKCKQINGFSPGRKVLFVKKMNELKDYILKLHYSSTQFTQCCVAVVALITVIYIFAVDVEGIVVFVVVDSLLHKVDVSVTVRDLSCWRCTT